MALSGGYIDVIGAGDHDDSRHVDAGQWCLNKTYIDYYVEVLHLVDRCRSTRAPCTPAS